MKRYSAGHVITMVLAVSGLLGFWVPVMGQSPNPESPQDWAPKSAQNSPDKSSPPDITRYVRPAIPADRKNTQDRSSPPDTTHHVRPAIPADRMNTPVQPDRSPPPDKGS
jgi:cytoskeletal protein RodZ